MLPTITVAFYYLATPMLIMRDSMLEVLGSDFIELAKAKGLKPHVVMIRHAARNALLPVLTVSSVLLGFAIGGQVIVEQVFSWPGMGQLMVEAASSPRLSGGPGHLPAAGGAGHRAQPAGRHLLLLPGPAHQDGQGVRRTKMKITRLELFHIAIPFAKPYRLSKAYGTLTDAHAVILKMHTDEGVVGLGEADPLNPFTEETPGTVMAVMRDAIGPRLMGQDPTRVGALLSALDGAVLGNPTARGAVDMALHDILGKVERCAGSRPFRRTAARRAADSLGDRQREPRRGRGRDRRADGARLPHRHDQDGGAADRR